MSEGVPVVRTITVQHDGACMVCEETIRAGQRAQWCPGVGVWHLGCDTPRNLQAHHRAAQQKRELGL